MSLSKTAHLQQPGVTAMRMHYVIVGKPRGTMCGVMFVPTGRVRKGKHPYSDVNRLFASECEWMVPGTVDPNV